jgi:MAF protein
MIAHPDHSVKTGIVLASASPRRRELITLPGLPIETTTAEIDEAPLPGEHAAAMAQRLSIEKARAASSNILRPAAGVLLASDTVVSLDGAPLGKPRDAAEARSMLQRLRGRTHQVYTAITLIDLQADQARSARALTDVACSDVPMRAYTGAEIEAYVASGDPFDKAGAYAIQHDGFHPVENFKHCFANVMGLPLCHVTRSLRKMGIAVKNDVPALCQAHLGYHCPVHETILASNE